MHFQAGCRRLLALALLISTPGCAAWSGARLYSAGTHALDHGDTATAISDLEGAAQLLPESSEIQNHLGIAYEAAGRADAALAAYERAVALDCRNEAAAHNLRAMDARGASAPAASLGAAEP